MPIVIEVPEIHLFDERTMEFVDLKPRKLTFEHSLVSISKWEAKWHKPYLSDNKSQGMTPEQFVSYLECMCMTSNVPKETFKFMPQDCLKSIMDYINDSMTATWFSEDNKPKGRQKVLTSEVIYSKMIMLNIPVEFQKWHLNRLMVLIRVCAEENSPPKKMSKKEILDRNRRLNATRRKNGKG